MTVALPSHPSSAAFDAIAQALGSDADKKDAIKKANQIFAFTLKNSAGKTESWYLDLKETGEVGRGAAPQGKKAGVTMSLADADFQKMIDGKAKAQQLFMSGKLKIKGNVMGATKLEPILNKAKNQAKL